MYIYTVTVRKIDGKVICGDFQEHDMPEDSTTVQTVKVQPDNLVIGPIDDGFLFFCPDPEKLYWITVGAKMLVDVINEGWEVYHDRMKNLQSQFTAGEINKEQLIQLSKDGR